jgi:hypothetical protein
MATHVLQYRSGNSGFAAMWSSSRRARSYIAHSFICSLLEDALLDGFSSDEWLGQCAMQLPVWLSELHSAAGPLVLQ